MTWLLTLVLCSAIIGWGYSLKYLEQLEKERKDWRELESDYKQEIFDLLSEIQEMQDNRKNGGI